MYHLELTEEDVKTIAFVGGRYSWSSSLLGYEAGMHTISELDAIDLKKAFREDDSPFPMLSPTCPLFKKLTTFYITVGS